MASLHLPKGAAIFVGLLNVVLWAAKLAFCIFLMKYFMQKFYKDNPDIGNTDTFKFGSAVAILSALVFSGFNLAFVSFIAPDTYAEALSLITENYSSMLGSEELEQLENINIGQISFWSNLLYCSIFGTVLSLILSRNIPSRNPFDQDRFNDDNE